MVRRIAFWAGYVAVLSAPLVAEVHGEVLGTGAPPEELGGVPVVPFNLDPQAAIPDFELVLEIPGGPAGPIPVNDFLQKLTVPTTFSSWSHGYTGPVFAKYLSNDGTEPNRVLTLPGATRAFYLYVQVVGPGPESIFVFSGGVLLHSAVDPNGGATGFGFFTDGPAESLSEIVISGTDYAVGELGIGGEVIPVELQTFSIE
jgi:hypothetical protein